jgi:hypothetical protein
MLAAVPQETAPAVADCRAEGPESSCYGGVCGLSNALLFMMLSYYLLSALLCSYIYSFYTSRNRFSLCII